MTQTVDWWAISAPLAVVAAGVAALLADAFVPRAGRWLPPALSLGGLTVAAAVTIRLHNEPRAAFCLPHPRDAPAACSWIVNDVTVVWWLVVVAATALIVVLLVPAVGVDELPSGELHFLLLASATGALAVAAAGDLITLLVAMETVSLPAFALVGLRRRDRRGAEAALKFFIASVVATSFSLLGISMVYGATGSVAAGEVATSVATGAALTPVIGVGMVLTVVALGFKTAAVPFQVWVPDTYVGAPIPVAAYLSIVSKAAGLAGLTVVLLRFFPTYADTWSTVIAVSAAATMTVGNLAALRQQHAVRLLAWSSVAQAGYLLVPLAAGGTSADIGALQAYILMYAVVNVTAFAVVLAGARWGATTVSDFGGLARSSPWLGVALAFALLCLAGLPPGVVGLMAKVVIFQSAVSADLIWLAVVMAVNVAIGLVYYLRFLAVLFSASDQRQQVPTEWSPGAGVDGPEFVVDAHPAIDFVVGVTLAAAVVLSVFPGLLFNAVIG